MQLPDWATERVTATERRNYALRQLHRFGLGPAIAHKNQLSRTLNA